MPVQLMIVDDHTVLRQGLKLLFDGTPDLRVAGEASSGAEALALLAASPVDIAIVDLSMPEMDGIQALKKIKEADANACVIMCSAMGQQAMVIEAIQSGAKDFIVKPFQAERVLEAVKKVIG